MQNTTEYSVHITQSAKDHWLAEMNATQSRRSQNLRRYCNQQHIQVADLENTKDLLEIRSNTPPLDAFVFDDNFEFMVSVIQKVGSKHWRNLFSDLRRRVNSHRRQSGRVRSYPNGALLSQVKDIRELKYRLQNYKKIIFTRHPLVRALSAYRDKFEKDVVDYCWSVGSIILNNYRRNYTGLDVRHVHDISFSEFVEFITDPNAPDEKNDRHWIPISQRSNPCRIAYDVLGKLETIDDDMRFVFEYLDIQGLVKYNEHQETRSSQTETIKHYYSQLSPRLFSRIIDLYAQDFEMFGYRVPKDRRDFNNLVMF
ncbi:carbohydrate sulfotransferase 14-like isoform X2 [Anneissia japonica]|nr:carbohydrate sulfotransferase 14-like isoform X2 [Anneissia japonica]